MFFFVVLIGIRVSLVVATDFAECHVVYSFLLLQVMRNMEGVGQYLGRFLHLIYLLEVNSAETVADPAVVDKVIDYNDQSARCSAHSNINVLFVFMSLFETLSNFLLFYSFGLFFLVLIWILKVLLLLLGIHQLLCNLYLFQVIFIS